MSFIEEQTATHYISVLSSDNYREHIAEAFIKDDGGFIWHAILSYRRLPTKSLIMRDTYVRNSKSIRPYKPEQPCDGSTTAPIYHLYTQLCQYLQVDAIVVYQEAYKNHIFTKDQLNSIVEFAQWQGVEIITTWNETVIDLILERLQNLCMHELASILSNKILI